LASIELARVLVAKRWTQYRLVREAGFAHSTARRLLGHGEPTAPAMERAAALVGLVLVLRRRRA